MIYGLLKRHILRSQYKVISFDIFDTLIERRQLSPLDLFMDVGLKIIGDKQAQSFCYDRIKAENDARKNDSSGETTIDEIYELLRMKYAESCDLLKKMEIQYEIESCQKKKAIYEIYKEAQRFGKKIIIVSDMYLSRDTLENMLHRCGYEGFEALYISNEENASKRNGKLFDIVFKKEKINPGEVIHVGDSLKADFLSARNSGMASILIPRKYALRRKLHEKSIRSKC